MVPLHQPAHGLKSVGLYLSFSALRTPNSFHTLPQMCKQTCRSVSNWAQLCVQLVCLLMLRAEVNSALMKNWCELFHSCIFHANLAASFIFYSFLDHCMLHFIQAKCTDLEPRTVACSVNNMDLIWLLFFVLFLITEVLWYFWHLFVYSELSSDHPAPDCLFPAWCLSVGVEMQPFRSYQHGEITIIHFEWRKSVNESIRGTVLFFLKGPPLSYFGLWYFDFKNNWCKYA